MLCRYLSRCLLIDVLRSKRYYFLCNSWFGADIGDGRVDRVFRLARKDQLHDVEHLFVSHAVRSVSHNATF